MKGVKRGVAILIANCVFLSGTVCASDVNNVLTDGRTSVESNTEEYSDEQVEDVGDIDETIHEDAETEYIQNEIESEEIDEKSEAEVIETEELEEEEATADEATLNLLKQYEDVLNQIQTMESVETCSVDLNSFPVSYRTLLSQLQQRHPNWSFVPVNTDIYWSDVVAQESVSGTSNGTNRSLLPKTSGSLLLSKASTDYNASTGSYIPKDGSTWVSASRPAVAYYADPRNFLTDQYVFMFEALDFNGQYQTVQGVENILKGTDLSNKTIQYFNTNGQKITLDITYGQAIFAAGQTNKVNPLFLAARIRQETGGKLTYGSISGNFSYGGKSYQGYYNFFNIGAYSTSTGSAVANGLEYAMKKNASYGRAWTSPLLAINGGAQFLASSYIAKGQNTTYFERFNTVTKPYFSHQYMQNLTAAASEAKTTYDSYVKMNIVENPYVFYVPVYKDMPLQENAVKILKTQNTGVITGSVNMRQAPVIDNSNIIMTIPKDKTVTLQEICYTSATESVYNQEKNPYWAKITYGSKTGYISLKYLKMNSDLTIRPGETKKVAVFGMENNEKVYFETSNPAIATVAVDGTIKGVKAGTCDIYVVSGSGKKADAVGVTVTGSAVLQAPTLSSVSNGEKSITFKWKKSSGAKGYYVYRKTGNGSYKKIKTIKSASTVKYTDKSVSAGKTYTYTVKAYNGSKTSSYAANGLTIKFLKKPSKPSVSNKASGIRVKWKSVKGASAYKVLRKSKGKDYEIIAEIPAAKKSSYTYTDKNVKKGKKYYYIIRAYSGGSKSVRSSSKSITRK